MELGALPASGSSTTRNPRNVGLDRYGNAIGNPVDQALALFAQIIDLRLKMTSQPVASHVAGGRSVTAKFLKSNCQGGQLVPGHFGHSEHIHWLSGPTARSKGRATGIASPNAKQNLVNLCRRERPRHQIFAICE